MQRAQNYLTPSENPRSLCAHMKILVAEDDVPLAEFLQQRLQQEQFAVQIATTCGEAEHLALEQHFDIVLLELNLQGATALEALRTIRSRQAVCLCRACGAHSGCASPRGRPGEALLQVADLKLDRLTHTVQRAGRSIDLSPKEFALLEFLMMHRGQAVSRSAIVEQVWKLNFDTMTNVVDVYINYLRRKIDSGHDHALIRTVRGVGYQISVEPAAVRAHLTMAR
jgi:two-component system, OmpR family, copper resistance phosphate regulon response regulator CusR